MPLNRALKCSEHHAGGGQGRPAEETLWSYLVQLTSAARAAHSAGLLLRPHTLAPSKVVLTSPRRIRVGAHTQPSITRALLATQVPACAGSRVLWTAWVPVRQHSAQDRVATERAAAYWCMQCVTQAMPAGAVHFRP